MHRSPFHQIWESVLFKPDPTFVFCKKQNKQLIERLNPLLGYYAIIVSPRASLRVHVLGAAVLVSAQPRGKKGWVDSLRALWCSLSARGSLKTAIGGSPGAPFAFNNPHRRTPRMTQSRSAFWGGRRNPCDKREGRGRNHPSPCVISIITYIWKVHNLAHAVL